MSAKVQRRSQLERRQSSRDALLEAGARHLSRLGYSALSLDRLAREAGYTRGALYHQFPSKEAFVLAVVDWVERAWYEEVLAQVPDGVDPATALEEVARLHAVFCRRDIAGVAMTLRVELGRREHPVGDAVRAATERVVADCAALVVAGRASGTIPPGVPSQVLAAAVVHAVEGLVIGTQGQVPYDEELAQAAVTGLLRPSAPD